MRKFKVGDILIYATEEDDRGTSYTITSISDTNYYLLKRKSNDPAQRPFPANHITVETALKLFNSNDPQLPEWF